MIGGPEGPPRLIAGILPLVDSRARRLSVFVPAEQGGSRSERTNDHNVARLSIN